MEYIVGDLLKSNEQVIGHGVNCQGEMNSGIAVQFKEAFPDMFDEYRFFCLFSLEHSINILGSCFLWLPNDPDDTVIVNLFTQFEQGPNADYIAIRNSVVNAVDMLKERGINRIALPKIGSGVGGLKWQPIETTLKAIENVHNIEIAIYVLPSSFDPSSEESSGLKVFY